MKIVKYIEESVLLIKGVEEMEQKNKKSMSQFRLIL